MAEILISKYNALPATADPNELLFVKNGSVVSMYVADNAGSPIGVIPAGDYVKKVNGLGGNVQLDLTFSGGSLNITGGNNSVNLDNRYFKTTDNLAWSQVSGKPTTIAGYGITDAYTKTESDAITGLLSNLSTTTKTNLVAAINELLTSVNEGMKTPTPIDCSANPNYPASAEGDTYKVTAAGKIGGASGKTVNVNDTIICTATNGGGDEAAVGSSFYVIEGNLSDATTSVKGIGRIATQAEVNAGTENKAWVTPGTQNTLLTENYYDKTQSDGRYLQSSDYNSYEYIAENVTKDVPVVFKDVDGTPLTSSYTNRAYLITLQTINTGTDTGIKYGLYYDGGWKTVKIGNQSTISNTPEIIIQSGIPYVAFPNFTSTQAYNIQVNVSYIPATTHNTTGIFGLTNADIPSTPSLQEVTDVGATTTDNVTVNSLSLTTPPASASAASKVFVLGSDGHTISTRTSSEILSDIGAVSTSSNSSNGSGAFTGDFDLINNTSIGYINSASPNIPGGNGGILFTGSINPSSPNTHQFELFGAVTTEDFLVYRKRFGGTLGNFYRVASREWVSSQGYLTSETDPVFSASAAGGITATDITNWDAAFTAKHDALTLGANKNGLSLSTQVLQLELATTIAAGAMSSTDKSKLNGIAASANNYTLPTATASILGGVKVGDNMAIDAGGKLTAEWKTVEW